MNALLPRLVVMVSGNGSNLQALIDAIERGSLRAAIVLVVSSDPDAFALKRAIGAGIPAIALTGLRNPALDRAAARKAYDKMLAEAIEPYAPEYIFLLGWMMILGDEFISHFPGKIVNLHPALPGTFPGTHAIERAWQAFCRGDLSETGVMTHFVPDGQVDAGPVIFSERVQIGESKSLEDLERRMHEVEHLLVVKTALQLVGKSKAKGAQHMPMAIISVYDKTGLVDFAGSIEKLGWNILASGGTAKTLKTAGIGVREIADYTGAPEILGGRVKTLHPAIHGGILARGSGGDFEEIGRLGYEAVDLVIVNLYPFERTIADPSSNYEDGVEQIDIGGVALIRAAAKNHGRVTVVCDIADYQVVLDELKAKGSVPEVMRQKLAAKAFAHTALYDTAIGSWLAGKAEAAGAADPAGEKIALPHVLRGWKAQGLRYGENPHQCAELYSFERDAGPLGGRVLQGKELSYNNILDLDAAWHAVGRFSRPAAVVVKHLSPCGIAESQSESAAALPDALSLAIECDPISAFGGVIATNAAFTGECAQRLGSLFVECIAAPGFDDEALVLLSKKKNLRLIVPGSGRQHSEIRTVLGGFLRQDIDAGDPAGIEWRTVSKRAPTETELRDLHFAWKACMSAKSNAIVLASGGATVGIGSGQPNRVDSVRIAVQRAGERARESVLASDAFFPFPDSVEEAARAGVTAIAHPGGSMRDTESVEAADRAGIAMVVTGLRHFRH